MSKRSLSGACLFCRYTIRPHAFTRAYLQPVQQPLTKGPNRNNDLEPEIDSSLAYTPSQLEDQLRLGSTADVLRRVFLGPRTVQRARLINRRLYDEHFGRHDKSKPRPQRAPASKLADPGQWGDTDGWLDTIEGVSKSMLDNASMVVGRHEAGREVGPGSSVHLTEDKRRGQSLEYGRRRHVREQETQLIEEEEGKEVGPMYYRIREMLLAKDPTLDLMMDLLRFQLRSSATPEDLTRVFTVAFQSRHGLRLLASPSVHRIIAKQLARSSPQRILGCLSLFIARIEAGKQAVSSDLIWQALLAASVTQSTTAIRRYMKMWQEHDSRLGLSVSINAFVELLRALRNGNRANEHRHEHASRRAMLEIMYGFSDPSFGGLYNLRHYLPVQNRTAFNQWIQTLVDLNAGDQIWNEWELLKARTSNTDIWNLHLPKMKRRSPPALFMRAMFSVGEHSRAWTIYRLHSRAISHDDGELWHILFQNISLKPALDEDSQKRLESKALRLLEHELLALESNLGLKWKPTGDDGIGGHHIATPRALQSLFSMNSPPTRTTSDSPHPEEPDNPPLEASTTSAVTRKFEREPE